MNTCTCVCIEFYSLTLQGTVGMDLRFLDAECGPSGRCHDSKTFSNSMLHRMLEEGGLPAGFHLLGDKAYTHRTFLLTPYRRAYGHAHRTRFNYHHAQARNVVERAFGRLKNRSVSFSLSLPLSRFPCPRTRVCVCVCVYACVYAFPFACLHVGLCVLPCMWTGGE